MRPRPAFWPHTIVYLGPPPTPAARLAKWYGDRLESGCALRSGVRIPYLALYCAARGPCAGRLRLPRSLHAPAARPGGIPPPEPAGLRIVRTGAL